MLSSADINKQYEMYMLGNTTSKKIPIKSISELYNSNEKQLTNQYQELCITIPEISGIHHESKDANWSNHKALYELEGGIAKRCSIHFHGAEINAFHIMRIAAHAMMRMPENREKCYISPVQDAWIRYEKATQFSIGSILRMQSLHRYLKNYKDEERAEILQSTAKNTGIYLADLKRYYEFELLYCKRDQEDFEQIQLDENQLWRYDALCGK